MSATTPGVLDGYLSRSEAAHELRVGVRTLDRWRANRRGPPFVRVGRRRYYSVCGIQKWLAGREQRPEPTSQASGAAEPERLHAARPSP